MPILATKTKKKIGNIIDPEIENDLDDETLKTQLNMLEELGRRNKLNKTLLAKYNYLKEISRQRNSTWKDVKTAKSAHKTIRFGKNKTKEFYKKLPVTKSIFKPTLKRTHTYGGNSKTRKQRK